MDIDGYRLPGIGRAGVPTHLQLKPHEGFAPEAIVPRVPPRRTPVERPAVLAQPADWTRQADCHGLWSLFDDPTPAELQRVVRPTCEACPVAEQCLAEALRDEDGQPSKVRSGIRAGTTPVERAKMQAPEPPERCIHGHKMGHAGSFFVPQNNQYLCKKCRAAQKRAYRAAKRKPAVA